jgi:hypothetical protein
VKLLQLAVDVAPVALAIVVSLARLPLVVVSPVQSLLNETSFIQTPQNTTNPYLLLFHLMS